MYCLFNTDKDFENYSFTSGKPMKQVEHYKSELVQTRKDYGLE